MKMFKIVLLSLALSLSTVVNGSCLPDPPELGDIGPDSNVVCQLLESWLPESNIAILDRNFPAYDTVSITVEVDGRHETIEYKLERADWKLTKSTFLSSN